MLFFPFSHLRKTSFIAASPHSNRLNITFLHSWFLLSCSFALPSPHFSSFFLRYRLTSPPLPSQRTASVGIGALRWKPLIRKIVCSPLLYLTHSPRYLYGDQSCLNRWRSLLFFSPFFPVAPLSLYSSPPCSPPEPQEKLQFVMTFSVFLGTFSTRPPPFFSPTFPIYSPPLF